MLLLLLQELFDGRVIQAMCWTLLHSLWQGLVLAIVGGIVIMLTRKSAPAVRYNCLSALFFLFFLSAILTFGLQLHSSGDPVNAGGPVLSAEYSSGGVDGSPTSLTIPSATGSSFINGLVSYFNAHAMLVVAIWFIIFSARLVRVLAHLGAIQRMRHYRTHAPSEYWGSRLQELALALKMRIRVVLLESEIVRVPMVVGFFKPVILVPFSLLSQLPPEQVEAILLHELAHIRRRDYFINLIQSFTEILFFFNPGVLWISSLMREERENCCDDIAVDQVKNKKEFIHALVSFHEYNNTGLRSAIAFAGSRDHLLQRVKRIIYHDNKILDVREKFFLLVCLMITGALTIAFSYRPQEASPVVPPVGKTGTIAPKTAVSAEADTAKPRHLQEARILDSVPDAARKERLRQQRELLTIQQKKLFEEQQRLSEQQQRLMEEEMKLSGDDGALIMEKKKVELDLMEMKVRLMAESHQMEDEDRRRKMTESDKRIMEKKIHEMQERTRDMGENWKQMSEGDRRLMEMKLRTMEEERRREMEDAEKNLRQAQDMKEQKEEMMENSRKSLEDSRRMMDENKLRMEENKEHMKAEMERRKEEMHEHQQEFHEKSMATVAPILEFLVTEKLITDKDNVSFSLTADGLVVNGKKQPDALFRQARDKYLKDRGDKIVYSRKGSSESFSINRQ